MGALSVSFTSCPLALLIRARAFALTLLHKGGFCLCRHLFENGQACLVGHHHVELGEVGLGDACDPDGHLASVLIKNLLLCIELASYEVSELAALPIHAHVIRMETPALRNLVAGRHVLLETYLVVAVGEGAAVAKAATFIKPVLTDLSLLL